LKRLKIKPEKIQGTESVWDYPRPPQVEDTSREIEVQFNGETNAKTIRAKRVLEMSHPPVYYIPPEDIHEEFLVDSDRSTVCEFKGKACYYHVRVGKRTIENAAWYYPEPNGKYSYIKNHVAFYPQLMDRCIVDGEVVKSQPGSFYGGWITSDIAGPFKGGSKSMLW
jgi:uncharacterized protein (DUF427 family)